MTSRLSPSTALRRALRGARAIMHAGVAALSCLLAAACWRDGGEPGGRCYQGDRIDDSLPAPFVRPVEQSFGTAGSTWVVSWVDYAESETCYVLTERVFGPADVKLTRVHVLRANVTEWTSTGEDWKDAPAVEFDVYAAAEEARSPAGRFRLGLPLP